MLLAPARGRHYTLPNGFCISAIGHRLTGERPLRHKKFHLWERLPRRDPTAVIAGRGPLPQKMRLDQLADASAIGAVFVGADLPLVLRAAFLRAVFLAARALVAGALPRSSAAMSDSGLLMREL